VQLCSYKQLLAHSTYGKEATCLPVQREKVAHLKLDEDMVPTAQHRGGVCVEEFGVGVGAPPFTPTQKEHEGRART